MVDSFNDMSVNYGFAQIKNYIISFLKRFQVSRDATRLALLQAGERPETLINFTDEMSMAAYQAIIQSMQARGGSRTDLVAALDAAYRQLTNDGSRGGVPKFLIYFTAGLSKETGKEMDFIHKLRGLGE